MNPRKGDCRSWVRFGWLILVFALVGGAVGLKYGIEDSLRSSTIIKRHFLDSNYEVCIKKQSSNSKIPYLFCIE